MALAPSEVDSRRTSCVGNGRISWLKLSAAALLMTLIRKSERLINTDFRMAICHRQKLVLKLKASGVMKQESSTEDVVRKRIA